MKSLNNFYLTCETPSIVSYSNNIDYRIKKVEQNSRLFSDPSFYLLLLEDNLIGCFITKATLESFPNLSKFIDPSFKQGSHIIRLPNKIVPHLESVFLELPRWTKKSPEKWSLQEKRLAIELDPSICEIDEECVSERFIRINFIHKCINCGCGFDERDNKNTSCTYHPSKAKMHYDNGSKTYFECCGYINRTESSTMAHACAVGYHVR